MTEKALNYIATKLNRTLTDTDRIAFMDYCTYYGLTTDEELEYADAFIDECYHLTDGNPENDVFLRGDENGLYLELNYPDKLPFAHETHKDNWHQYSWGGCTITKLE